MCTYVGSCDVRIREKSSEETMVIAFGYLISITLLALAILARMGIINYRMGSPLAFLSASTAMLTYFVSLITTPGQHVAKTLESLRLRTLLTQEMIY